MGILPRRRKARFRLEAVFRQGSQHRLGIGVKGLPEKCLLGAPLHLLGGVQHRHLLGNLLGEAQVVGDAEDSLVFQPAEGVHHQFNPVSIQALGGFVSEEKRGPLCNPHGDHRPLAHPAAEGVGVLAGQLFLLPEVKTAQGCDSPGESLLFG